MASRLSRQGDGADVELGFLDKEQPSPSMIGVIVVRMEAICMEDLSYSEITL